MASPRSSYVKWLLGDHLPPGSHEPHWTDPWLPNLRPVLYGICCGYLLAELIRAVL